MPAVLLASCFSCQAILVASVEFVAFLFLVESVFCIYIGASSYFFCLDMVLLSATNCLFLTISLPVAQLVVLYNNCNRFNLCQLIFCAVWGVRNR